MVKIKSTVTPSERLTQPYSKPCMGDIIDFWSSEGCKINEQLYLQVIKAKNYGVLV